MNSPITKTGLTRFMYAKARRMIGEFVMTENEVLGKSPIPHSIGMGSYTMDSHNTQRYITPEGFVQKRRRHWRSSA